MDASTDVKLIWTDQRFRYNLQNRRGTEPGWWQICKHTHIHTHTHTHTYTHTHTHRAVTDITELSHDLFHISIWVDWEASTPFIMTASTIRGQKTLYIMPEVLHLKYSVKKLYCLECITV